jgi:hypothetical protein
MQRHRSSPHSLEDQLAAEKTRLELQLSDARHGPQRDALSEKIRRLDVASHINGWLRSPGLKSPE